MKWLIISSIFLLTACCPTVNLPEPGIVQPEPPVSLMQPGRELKTIQEGVTDE